MSNQKIFFSRSKLASLLTLFMLMIIAVGYLIVAPTAAHAKSSATQATTGAYTNLGNVQGQGGVQTSLIGPGSTASQQRDYLNYTYVNGTLDFVAVDPSTGHYQTYTSPVASEQGAWAMAAGADRNMYIGTFPNGHLLKFNTGASQLSDLGQVAPDPTTHTAQTYVWQLTTSPHNKKIYGCTYPSADLVAFSPLKGSTDIVNLGTMDPTHRNQYVRYCVADPNPASPYIYLALGSVYNQLAAYNVDTNKIAFHIETSYAGFATVYPGEDGKVYGTLGEGTSSTLRYLLSGGTHTSINQLTYAASTNTLTDGSRVTVTANSVSVAHPNKTISSFPFTYAGKDRSVFRMGLGPDQKIYGGTALPYNRFSIDPANAAAGVKDMGYVGAGEPYSFLSDAHDLYTVSYASPALQAYDPTKPLTASTNPTSVTSSQMPTDLRSKALVEGPDGRLYIGAIASYGQLTGSLLSWNSKNLSDVQGFFPIKDQGVSSLAVSNNSCANGSGSYCLVGGTTTEVGSGATPTTTSGQLFTWDPNKNTVMQQYAIPNAGNVNAINDLLTNPANGYVSGIANTNNGNYFFTFDPASGTFINGGILLPFGSFLYNSAAIYNGKMWGITTFGAFSIDLSNPTQAVYMPCGMPITAGFAILGDTLYFASYSGIWSYTIAQ